MTASWYNSFRERNGVKNQGIASIDLALNIEYTHLCNAMDLVGSIHSLFRRMRNEIMAVDHNNTKNQTNSIVIVSSDEINHGLPADHEFLVNASIQRRFLDVCFVIPFQIDSGFLFVQCTPNLFIWLTTIPIPLSDNIMLDYIISYPTIKSNSVMLAMGLIRSHSYWPFLILCEFLAPKCLLYVKSRIKDLLYKRITSKYNNRTKPVSTRPLLCMACSLRFVLRTVHIQYTWSSRTNGQQDHLALFWFVQMCTNVQDLIWN